MQLAWSECVDPIPMLELLEDQGSARQWQLFAVACAKRVLHLCPNEMHKNLLCLMEKRADGLLVWGELEQAYSEIVRSGTALAGNQAAANAILAALEVVRDRGASQLLVKRARAFSVDARRQESGNAAREEEWRAQCHLLREIFSPPHQPLSFDVDWLAWHNGLISGLAVEMYEHQAFDRMPILGDALEDAGCTDAAILNHCRQPGEHVRGCWVIDLLLGKE